MVKIDHKIQSEPSKAMPSSSSSSKKKYKGVRMRSWGSWVSEIRAPNQKTRIWLGSYSTPEAAARAYDAALLCLKGTSANLNFPITSSHYIPDTLMSPKSIQRVAAAAANNFLDNPTTPPSPNNPPSSSSSISSPSMSSSPSDQLDDDVSLMPSFGNYTTTVCEANYEPSTFGTYTTTCEGNDPMSMNTPWYEYNFDADHIINGALFDQPMIEDFNDEGDIRLWSFC